MNAPASDRRDDGPRARRRPWVAGVLNALLPPLGHVYVGELKRGVVVWLTTLAVVTAALLLLARPHGTRSLVLALVIVLAAGVLMIADACLLASRERSAWRPAASHRWLAYLGVAAVALLLREVYTVGYRTYLIRAYKIPSAAMSPTLKPGDHILVDKLTYFRRDPARYEVVVFVDPHDPTRDFIKRIIGLPGDTIEVRAKKVYVNGELSEQESRVIHLDERPVVPPSEAPAVRDCEFPRRASDVYRDWFGPCTVPPDHYFVMGDNRDRSQDSRFWGYVPRSSILGIARSIYWSWDADASGVRWDRIGQPVR